jgi:hypothetical protein
MGLRFSMCRRVVSDAVRRRYIGLRGVKGGFWRKALVANFGSEERMTFVGKIWTLELARLG